MKLTFINSGTSKVIDVYIDSVTLIIERAFNRESPDFIDGYISGGEIIRTSQLLAHQQYTFMSVFVFLIVCDIAANIFQNKISSFYSTIIEQIMEI